MSKNRKITKKTNPLVSFLLIVIVMAAGGTGIFHAVLNNRQVKIAREIRNIERQIKEHDRDVTNVEIRLSQHANFYDLREALKRRETELIEISQAAVVTLVPLLEDPLVVRNE